MWVESDFDEELDFLRVREKVEIAEAVKYERLAAEWRRYAAGTLREIQELRRNHSAVKAG